MAVKRKNAEVRSHNPRATKFKSIIILPFAIVGFCGLYAANFIYIVLVLALGAVGIIYLPMGLLRLMDRGSFIISDIAPLTMALLGVFCIAACIAAGISLAKICPGSVGLLHRYSAHFKQIWSGA